MDELFLGIDIGTSGIRAAAIDGDGRPRGEASVPMALPRIERAAIDQDPLIWWSAFEQALADLLVRLDGAAIRAIAVDGTSGTLLLTDADGEPLGPAFMYNDARSIDEAARIAEAAPPTSGAIGATSALAKLLHLVGKGANRERRARAASGGLVRRQARRPLRPFG